MFDQSYEDQFAPLKRHLLRYLRTVRWHYKSLLGQPRTLLVELRWRLGDEIMALPVLEALRAQHPRDTIVALSNYPDLLEDHPAIDQVNTDHPIIDKFILLRGAPRQTYRRQHYANQAGIDLPSTRPQIHLENWDASQIKSLIDASGPVVAIATGASWSTKRWRKDRWTALCKTLTARGAQIVALGQQDEGLGIGLCLVDKTTITQASAILRHATLLVCCDSGLMHLARAVGTPVLALFGPTDPNILIRDDADFTPITSDQECTGFWNTQREVPEPGICPWNHDCCLENISVQYVLDQVEKKIALPTQKKR